MKYIILFSTLTACCLGLGTQSEAAFPGKNGKIAFSSNRNASLTGIGNYQMYSINPNGTDLRNLSNNPAVNDIDGNWSADGLKLVFARSPTDLFSTNADIWVMNRDGSNQQQLTTNSGASGFNALPSWSPDGRHIVFASDTVGQLEVLDIKDESCRTGNCRTTLLPAPLLNGKPLIANNPKYSPDGKRIAFTAGDAAFPTTFVAVYIMNSDGTNIRQYTAADVQGQCPVDWSPDGSKLAFCEGLFNPSLQVVIGPTKFNAPIELSSPGVHVITPAPVGTPNGLDGGIAYNGTFSPNGRKVIYDFDACSSQFNCPFNSDLVKTDLFAEIYSVFIFGGTFENTRADWAVKVDEKNCR